ncbi:hypothetical protein ACIQF6_15645 [Kitasatospora sp. NPDC092948]|uniref:hypothetical protein n=1 Tax=Kitasatospora sp. NPDC092948 TaxID=3364088 RepID=UPI0037F8C355
MRALTRTVAALSLAAPVLLGCAGLASAHDVDDNAGMGGSSPEAHFATVDFIANATTAGIAGSGSFVSPNSVEHFSGFAVADDSGISGSATDAGAHW